MIGVIANPADHVVVREFFELFKTPWEFFRAGRRYEVLLCADDVEFEGTAELVLFYAGRKTNVDAGVEIQTCQQRDPCCVFSNSDYRVPIYGDAVTFGEKGPLLLTHEETGKCSAFLERTGNEARLRIGYDLFGEIRTLLTQGQPPAQAHIPTLELHIALLRGWISGCGIALTEIPPVPEGYRFIACLTHDVDHPFLPGHKLDHTTLGFLFRTVLLWFWDLVRGRTTIRNVLTNWKATLKLPLVHLGLAKDFWSDFDEQYEAAEKGLSSTYFVLPFKGNAGIGPQGKAPARRAAGYGAQDIADTIRRLTNTGREVGLHGIDAWCDSAKGCKEFEEIRRLTKTTRIGVRMHWLYQNEDSAATLERAGADYDSSVGYGVTVGYRAGATQVYKPLGATRMLELPLHLMDTALFYLSYLGLSEREAIERIAPMIENAVQFGGCLTINWHDRSLAPERLWGEPYRFVIEELKNRGAWFATAGQAVAWFRKRRSAEFETEGMESSSADVRIAVKAEDGLPGLLLRIRRPRSMDRASDLKPGTLVDARSTENVAAVPSPLEAGK